MVDLVGCVAAGGGGVSATVCQRRCAPAHRYRRFGHNEQDEPRFTHPQMYAVIEKHKRTAALYKQALVDAGVVTQVEADGTDACVSGARAA